MNYKNIFSERLRLLRTENNYTVKQLAEVLNLKSYTTIVKIESAVNAPSFEVFTTIADHFNVSLDYLTGRSDNREINR